MTSRTTWIEAGGTSKEDSLAEIRRMISSSQANLSICNRSPFLQGLVGLGLAALLGQGRDQENIEQIPVPRLQRMWLPSRVAMCSQAAGTGSLMKRRIFDLPARQQCNTKASGLYTGSTEKKVHETDCRRGAVTLRASSRAKQTLQQMSSTRSSMCGSWQPGAMQPICQRENPGARDRLHESDKEW